MGRGQHLRGEKIKEKFGFSYILEVPTIEFLVILIARSIGVTLAIIATLWLEDKNANSVQVLYLAVFFIKMWDIQWFLLHIQPFS